MKGTPIRQALSYGRTVVVGTVVGDTFHKNIDFNRHSLKQPPALCLSVDSLCLAKDAGAKRIEIKDTPTGVIYSSTIEHFERHAFPVKRGQAEKQLGLLLGDWQMSGGKHMKPSAYTSLPKTAQQLRLFETPKRYY